MCAPTNCKLCLCVKHVYMCIYELQKYVYVWMFVNCMHVNDRLMNILGENVHLFALY